MIAIIGAGAMGEAYIAGLIKAGIEPGRMVIAEKDADRAREVAERYDVRALDLAEAVAEAATLLLLVKPQDMSALLHDIAGHLNDGTVVVSLAAGVRIAALEGGLGDGVAVVRAMPNTPALIGLGVTGISPGRWCGPDQVDYVVSLLSSVGPVVQVPEELQDAVTATSGSGPAYVFLLMESMMAAAVGLGLSDDVAALLVTQTVLGAASMAAEPDADPTLLRTRVTSPNGTTAAALGVFEEAGLPTLVRRAMTAARDRSIELGSTSS